MDVKYQVFVSSTFEDLKDERRKVIEAILNLGHIPVGMEVFQAGDESQWAHIQRRIEECDYYLVIVAERYGSEQDGKSYTQMEYEFAREIGIPTAAFLLHSDARRTWPRDRVEFEKRTKVDTFRTICQQKLIKHWSNGDELASQVILALSELTRTNPGVGWVRADRVPSDKVMTELSRLSEEKRRLQEQVEKLSASTNLTIPQDVLYRINQLQMSFLDTYVEGFEAEDGLPALFDVFLILHPIFARGAEGWEIYERLSSHFYKIIEDQEGIENLCAAFSAEKLLEVSRVLINGRGKKIFTLTNYGKDFAMYAMHHEVQSAETNSV
jgi:hypothetical protein